MADLDWQTYLTSLSTNQSEIARAVEVSPGTVSRWFKRQTVPDAVQVIAVARAYQQSPTYALAAAGYLAIDEVGGSGNTHPALRLGDFSARELARELARRLDRADRDTAAAPSKLSTLRELLGSFTALRADESTEQMLAMIEDIELLPTHPDELSVHEVTTLCLRSLDAWSVDARTKDYVANPDIAEWDGAYNRAMWELAQAAGDGRAVAWGVEASAARGARVVMGAAMSVVAAMLLAAADQLVVPLDAAEERLWAIADEVAALR